ncbi:uncharacterized protein METZ01_LOCUS276213, partial [marine metagenome]
VHVPTSDIELVPVCVDVRHQFGRIIRVQVSTVEAFGPEGFVPSVRFCDVFDASLPGHGVDGNPETD